MRNLDSLIKKVEETVERHYLGNGAYARYMWQDAAGSRKMGINENNILVNVQPSTLKVVGAPQLTSIETNGVGNQLNYNFAPEVLEGIYNLGEK